MRSIGIVLISFNFLSSYQAEDELVAVTALIRHAIRLPESFYPNDPYMNKTWPFVLGDITNDGVTEMFNVGRWLKKNYENYLSNEYNQNEIYAQSHNYDRCLMSGEATMAGLYPPTSSEVWNKHINWQPIPIHTSPTTQDIILNMNACPKIGNESEAIKETKIYQDIMEKNKDYFAYISKHAGEPVDFSTIYPLFDTIYSEIKLNLPQPKWVEEIYTKLLPLVVQYTKMDSMLNIERRIQSGPILERIINQFDKAINGDDFGTTKTIYRKFMAYFATEWILYDLTYTLGLPSINIPHFGALYLIELRRKNGTYFVNILYRKSASIETKAVPSTIKGWNFDLDYENFKDIVQPYLVDSQEWVKSCEEFTDIKVNVSMNVPST